MNWRHRFNPFITLWGYVLSTAALGIGLALGWFFHRSQDAGASAATVKSQSVMPLPAEAGAYRVAPVSIEPAHAIAEKRLPVARRRDREVYDQRRAYSGAPPRIPHEVTESLPGLNCLACHEQGGYAAGFKAYAPKTPHPELTQCRQCHVPTRTSTSFAGGGHGANASVTAAHLRSLVAPGWRAYPGAPPPIPHALHMRENCSVCHTGPGAMEEIRTTHPERIGCTQCHVPQQSSTSFVRSLAGGVP
jgi:nitrate reductase (cytochrome), electron transfer subunit